MQKKLSTDPYKGVRDFYPEDMRVQNYIFSIWRKVAEQFGYVEYSASLLEYSDLYKSKGNDEIINEQTYSFTDRGGREVTLRPEMTPTLARMVAAKRKSLKFPLRWYSVPNVFRYERPQRGRRREHWQLNCDLVGIAGIEAEAEIISLAYAIMKAFGAKESDFVIKINNRIAMETALLAKGVLKKDIHALFRQWDKGGIPVGEKIEWASAIEQLLQSLKDKGILNAQFDANIVRGFDYYTGMVFEVFDTHADNRRSLFGGGRYDNLLEIFGVEPVPTVGFGMGDITILDFLETHSLPLS
ncbi:MAG: histidyl-tRNA synthetase [Parcubacteria group bacterium Gr01-1014_17]|nr:MAG: histidyl-tRNA synthetase [Parcubacteria group bacterium Gr01-1014_17]